MLSRLRDLLGDRLSTAAAVRDHHSRGGTCSGEHGDGLGKMKFLEAEHGRAALDVMRTITRALDPLNLMNPGKILPDAPD